MNWLGPLMGLLFGAAVGGLARLAVAAPPPLPDRSAPQVVSVPCPSVPEMRGSLKTLATEGDVALGRGTPARWPRAPSGTLPVDGMEDRIGIAVDQVGGLELLLTDCSERPCYAAVAVPPGQRRELQQLVRRLRSSLPGWQVAHEIPMALAHGDLTLVAVNLPYDPDAFQAIDPRRATLRGLTLRAQAVLLAEAP